MATYESELTAIHAAMDANPDYRKHVNRYPGGARGLAQSRANQSTPPVMTPCYCDSAYHPAGHAR